MGAMALPLRQGTVGGTRTDMRVHGFVTVAIYGKGARSDMRVLGIVTVAR